MRVWFKYTGGRLLRISLLFTGVCILAIFVLGYFFHCVLSDMKTLLSSANSGEVYTPAQSFYIQVIEKLDITKVIQSLAGVLIAVIARYGLRETSKNIALRFNDKDSKHEKNNLEGN